MRSVPSPSPVFFPTPAEFRAWLEQHHATVRELWVGFFKKTSGKGGTIYAEALDEALCFGWIDGLVRSLDAERYMQRFTPRQPGSIWSNVNVRHVARLTAAGRMHAAGLAAYAARDPKKTGIYSFEQRPKEFPAPIARQFRARRAAWKFWSDQPPGYRRQMTWWVLGAKQTATQARRLARLIEASAAARRIG